MKIVPMNPPLLHDPSLAEVVEALLVQNRYYGNPQNHTSTPRGDPNTALRELTAEELADRIAMRFSAEPTPPEIFKLFYDAVLVVIQRDFQKEITEQCVIDPSDPDGSRRLAAAFPLGRYDCVLAADRACQEEAASKMH